MELFFQNTLSKYKYYQISLFSLFVRKQAYSTFVSMKDLSVKFQFYFSLFNAHFINNKMKTL